MREKDARLPPSWVRSALGLLGEWAGGGTPSTENSAFWTNGTIPWVSPKDMKSFEIRDAQDYVTESAVKSSAATKLPAGSVLMVTRSGILRHTFPVAVTRREVAVNQDIKAIVPHEGIAPDFIVYALRYFADRILHECAKDGTTVQSIESSALKRFEIPIAPFPEQQRVVAALDELLSDLDAGAEALRRAQAKFKNYRAAVLKAAVEGQLTTEWRKQHADIEPASELLKRILTERWCRWEERELQRFAEKGQGSPRDWQARYSEATPPNPSNRAELPSGWCWATVDQIGEIQGGLQKSPRRVPVVNHYPYLRVANVQRGRVDLKELSRFELTEQELRQLSLQHGDLLIVEGNGSRTEIGRCAMWQGEIQNCVHQNHIIRVRPLTGIMAEYADLYVNSPAGQSEIQNVASSTSGLYTLSVSKVARLTLPLPPLLEQEAVVGVVEEQLSMIDHVEANIEARLSTAQALRRSVLHRAFTGQLVPQDPNDEPASALLKRIAAERAKRSNLKPRQRAKTS